jgi:hypothetical protein
MKFKQKWMSLLLVIALMLSLTNPGFIPVSAASVIQNYNGTTVNFDETAGTPVVLAPALNIVDADGFNENSYIEFEITGAKSSETLGLVKVANIGAVSTILNEISILGNLVYRGTGASYEAVGSIDAVKNGLNGQPLRINFSRELENANFTEGATNTNFDDKDGVITNALPGWTVDHGTFNLTDAGLNSRSLGNALTIAGGGPYTMTKADPSGYSYTTDFNYNAGAWLYESVERPSGGLTTQVKIVTNQGGVGDRALELNSSGSVVGNNGAPEKYGSHFGPVVYSASFAAKEDDVLSMDWKAQFVQDHYEVYAFIKNTGTGVYTLLFYGRGENQSWTTSTGTIPADGTYQFVFINGTYDKTGGFVVGSKLWIDNIKVYGDTYSQEVAQGIALKATYDSTDKDPDATRTVTLRVVNKNSEMSTATATVNINNQFSHAPSITTTVNNPQFNDGSTSTGLIFSSTNASTVEAAEKFDELTLTISDLQDGANEILRLDGQDIPIVDLASGVTTANSIAYAISIAGGTATIQLTAMDLTDAEMNTFLNTLEYKNTATPTTVGTRTVSLTSVKDTGDDTGVGENVTALALASTINVSHVVSDFTLTARRATEADFTWTAPIGATSMKIQRSADGTTWVDATHGALANNAASATVTALSAATTYYFRLLVVGGENAGATSAVLSSADTLVTSGVYTVTNGQSANEQIRGLTASTTKASLLTNLTKNYAGQTWNSTGINDPVQLNDTLVVTAQNGVRTTTYTVASIQHSSLSVQSKTEATVTLTWTAAIGATALKVVQSEDNGATWTDSVTGVLTADATTAVVTGLTTGKTYLFKLQITNGANAGSSTTVSASLSSPTPTSSTSGTVVLVNGVPQIAGQEVSNVNPEGVTVVDLTVDPVVVNKKIEEMKKSDGNTVVIPVNSTNSGELNVKLTGDIVDNMEGNGYELAVELDTIQYIMPAAEIGIDKVAKDLGVTDTKLQTIEINIEIDQVDPALLILIEKRAAARRNEILFPPTSFRITASTTDANGNTRSVSVSRFNQYVERIMEIPAGVDPKKITTGIVYNADGTFSHIPTDVFQANGKYYARLNSLTNSVYTVIWNPIQVASVAGHWSEVAVNNMASRLVVKDPSLFVPTGKITRGEFAEYISKALGIYRTKVTFNNKFSDISKVHPLADAIMTASDYGIITGYPDGTFRPYATITREEAMVMYARAMDVIQFKGTNTERIKQYTDVGKVSGWALDYVKKVTSGSVFNGTSATTLSPKSTFTYAEAAQAIQNLLVESGLINK